MESGGHHQDKADAAYLFPHQILGLESIGDDVGKGTIVTDRAGQDEFDAFLDAGIEDPAAQQTLLHRLPDAARLSDLVDGPQMVFVTLSGADLLVQVDAEGGAIERGLDIVDRQAVAREENLNIALLDHFHEILRGARVNQAGTGHDQDLAALLAHLFHGLGDFLD